MGESLQDLRPCAPAITSMDADGFAEAFSHEGLVGEGLREGGKRQVCGLDGARERADVVGLWMRQPAFKLR